MLFWKRVEIYCGFSLKEFSELRDALVAKGISYDYKITNLNNTTRNQIIGLTPNPNKDKIYYLYVHHKDYDHAMHITSNRNVS